jgi:hypothetical protein
MAQLTGAYYMSHASWCYQPGEEWDVIRGGRRHRSDVPLDDLSANQKKAARIAAARNALHAAVERDAPDVLVVFGDDQMEGFDFGNFPALSVYAGPQIEGRRNNEGRRGDDQPRGIAPGHPDVAVALLMGLMQRGFDPAFSLEWPKPERGMCHAIMRPAETLGDFEIPIVPVLVNHYFAPQPTAMRSYQLGRAIRETIDQLPLALRIGVCGSGGMWHTPNAPGAWLNEEFDSYLLDRLRVGDARAMAEYFDAYQIPENDTSQRHYLAQRDRQITGLPGFGGPQGGSRETCSWIAAAAVVEGQPSEIIDYVPVYASPLGVGYAYTRLT